MDTEHAVIAAITTVPQTIFSVFFFFLSSENRTLTSNITVQAFPSRVVRSFQNKFKTAMTAYDHRVQPIDGKRPTEVFSFFLFNYVVRYLPSKTFRE